MPSSSHLSGIDVSFDLENKKESKNVSGQTYVKDDDIANMDDFDVKNHSGSVVKVGCAFLYVATMNCIIIYRVSPNSADF